MTATHLLAPPRAPLVTPRSLQLEVLGEPDVALVVYAKPAPKGSKDYLGQRKSRKTGRMVPKLVESAAADLEVLDEAVSWVWRARRPAGWVPLDGPLVADMTFTLARPKNHYGTGRNAGQLKEWAAPLVWHHVYPDTDKLVRGLGDALTKAGVWADDARLAAFRYGPNKVYERAPLPDALRKPGAVVRLWKLEKET